MNDKKITWTVAIVTVTLFLYLTPDGFSATQQQKSSEVTIKDEPQARALYKKMIETIRTAETLLYESNLKEEDDGEMWEPWTYRVWMKKPNFFRVETQDKDGKNHGILVGDGRYAWSYWPNGRPWFSGEDRDDYEKSRFKVYMKEPAPGKYSIGYAKVMLKSNCFPVLNPSVFQGINDSLEPYIEWVRCHGVERVGREDCDVIEVSLIDLKVLRTKGEHITQEVWSKVRLNAPIPPEMFRWTPPDGWTQWHPPTAEDRLLKPSRPAPDFDLLSVDKSRINLSGYRGKVVWLTFWRVGCPPCREQIPYLEELYRKHKDKGLVVLGFDFADDRQIALDFLRQHSVTFPNIVDASDDAVKTGFIEYQARAAPVNYIIDRKGKIAGAWLGHDPNSPQGADVLTRLGLN